MTCAAKVGFKTTAMGPDGVKPPVPGSPSKSSVSPDLMEYYSQITRAILSGNEATLQFALEDLQTNDHITPLLPYLINFVSTGLKKLSHDLSQMTKLLHTINSLVTNNSLNLNCKPYLSLLVQAVQYCILEPLAACINPVNDHWALRDSAALLLAHILRIWSTGHNNLRATTVGALRESFADLSRPFCYHYGAVVGLLAIDPEMAGKELCPHLALYWPHLTSALSASALSSAQVKLDAHRVHGSLLAMAEMVLRRRTWEIRAALESDPQNPPLPAMASLNLLYSQFYEYFGDALRLPPTTFLAPERLYIHKIPPPLNLFSAPELMQTGEQLLEAFYEKEEEVKSSVEDYNSYDDNSSDDNNDGKVALQIKSTINDPALGIKLTIAKLRRDRPPASPPPPQAKVRRTRPSRGDSQDPVFDSSILRLPRLMEFCFEGSTPVPPRLLRQYRPAPPAEPSHFYRLNLKRLPRAGPLKPRPHPRTLYRRRFLGGNLECFL